MNTETERKHHPFSPSKLQYLECCPCYESRESKHARTIAGTKAHKVAESGIDDKELDDDDAVAIAECLDFVNKRRQEMGNPTELKEEYLPIDDEDTTAGYVDHALISQDQMCAELIDYKFGMWPVTEAAENLQGIAYSLGLFKKFPKLQQITFWFLQPHIESTTSAIFTRGDIPRLYLRVCTVVARAKEARRVDDFGTAKAATPVCLFCANLGRCPVVAKIACKVGSKFYPAEIPESITPTDVQDPKNIGLGLKLAAIVKTWSEAFRSCATNRVLQGAPLPDGYRIESRQGNREVKNFQAFKHLALQYMTEQEFETACSVSIGAVEKSISDKAPRGEKKVAVEMFKTLLEEAKITERGNPYSFLKAI